MKSTNSNHSENSSKSTPSTKTNKKTTKSRAKTTKAELGSSSANNNVTSSKNAGANSGISSASIIGNHHNHVTTPTTPTTMGSNMFETPLTGSSGGGAGGSGSIVDSANAGSRSHHKSYAGLEPRSIKIIWEQHDQSDVELSAEVCTRVAEDASYKLWELINNIKTYARHSGGVITYDLVNEVLRDADVPPALGAMDSDWDRIDYDGSYFFYSDKIIELRDEYQKDVSVVMPDGPDFMCSRPVEDKNAELLKKYIPNLFYVSLYGDNSSLETALFEAAFSPIIGASYRVILAKVIQMLAFKQNDPISARCWRLLRACSFNPNTRDIDCRGEHFHLTEILICQLLAPYESIKVQSYVNDNVKTEEEHDLTQSQEHTIKMEMEESNLEQHIDMKSEYMEHQQDMFHNTPLNMHEEEHELTQSQEHTMKMEIEESKLEQHLDMKSEYMEQQQDMFQNTPPNINEEKIYKLQTDEEEEDEEKQQLRLQQLPELSPYFASPVDWKCVDELCETLGQLAVSSAYFQSECIFHITRRLERFFENRIVSTEREYNYINRAVRGLLALGEYAWREFIPFVYKFNAEDVPECLWHNFALAAVFLNGPDDIFLYEWLELLCGADKLQPFMVYYAQYHEKLLTMRFLKRKKATFKINPKVSVRRLEWNTLAAAMCHGDDPNKALKPKPTMSEVFPELIKPNLQLNRAGTIRFKFAGCRPVIIKPKTTAAAQMRQKLESKTNTGGLGQNDILIARRKLFKPLTNERRIIPLSSYYYARI